jgi:5-methyltetrahydrofolate--homocysteine methyltransferase
VERTRRARSASKGFLDALQSPQILLMDGAMGTQLQQLGIQPGECYELWNLTHPSQVQGIHQAYVEAGAEVLLTNTFQLHPLHLERHGLLEKASAIGRQAITLARASHPSWILGDIGPMPEFPGGPSFPRQETLDLCVQWLSGVDALLLETCSDRSGLQAASWLQKTNLPVLLSITYQTDPDKGICTRDGLLPEEFAQEAKKAGVAVLGVNCGRDQDMNHIAEVLHRYRRATDLPLFARPNAGTPRKTSPVAPIKPHHDRRLLRHHPRPHPRLRPRVK